MGYFLFYFFGHAVYHAGPHTVEAWSLNHWTAREVSRVFPDTYLLILGKVIFNYSLKFPVRATDFRK